MEHEDDNYTNPDRCFCTVTKGWLKGLEDLEIRGRVETIQTSTLLWTARILRRILETWGDLLSLKLQWNTISQRWYEKLSRRRRKRKKELIPGPCQRAKELWIIPVVFGALRTVSKDLEKILEELVMKEIILTLQTTALSKSAQILRKVHEKGGDLQSVRLQWKTISQRRCEKIAWSNNNNNNNK